MPIKAVQFHPRYCEEAKDSRFPEWDSSHDLSLIVDEERQKIGHMKHASVAYAIGRLIEENYDAFKRYNREFYLGTGKEQ